MRELREAAHRKLDEARSEEAAGNLQQAAGAYRKVARILREMAKLEVTVMDATRRNRKAKAAEAMAEKLERGERTTQEQTALSEQGPSTLQDYRASIDELICKTSVDWSQIGGMNNVKGALKYLFGLMLANPPDGVELAKTSNILLYGPPGTGKTLLAGACSNMLNATFFSVKASNLLSKYFGESTKLVSALYARARSVEDTGVAVVFIDEIDALSGQRGNGDSSGAERRVVATLLAELDGIRERGQSTNIITIAATNMPWSMDSAILQRFDRHVLVPLPDTKARSEIFRIHVEKKGLTLQGTTCEDLAAKTAGFSGRLIRRACAIAIHNMVREVNQQIPVLVDSGEIASYTVATRPLNETDFVEALTVVKSRGTSHEMKPYEKWAHTTGGERA